MEPDTIYVIFAQGAEEASVPIFYCETEAGAFTALELYAKAEAERLALEAGREVYTATGPEPGQHRLLTQEVGLLFDGPVVDRVSYTCEKVLHLRRWKGAGADEADSASDTGDESDGVFFADEKTEEE